MSQTALYINERRVPDQENCFFISENSTFKTLSALKCVCSFLLLRILFIFWDKNDAERRKELQLSK